MEEKCRAISSHGYTREETCYLCGKDVPTICIKNGILGGARGNDVHLSHVPDDAYHL